MTRAPDRLPRLILGATCYSDAYSTIELAVPLAGRLGAELLGVLIEEDAILSYAGMPDARTIGEPGKAAQQVTAEKMMAAFRQDAAQFKRALGQAATVAKIAWSFEQRRGQFSRVFEGLAGTGDLLVLAYARPRHHRRAIALVMGQNATPALYSNAAGVAQETGLPLVIFVPVAASAKIRAELMQDLPNHRRAPDVVVRDYASYDDLMRQIGALAAGLVFLAADVTGKLDLRQLTDAARCPVAIDSGLREPGAAPQPGQDTAGPQ